MGKTRQEAKDSNAQPLESNTWYWITSPHEGDIWYPINVQDVYYIMDGKPRYEFGDLDDLVVKKAEMPVCQE